MDTLMLDQLPCAVFVTDARGFVLGANSELLRLSGETSAKLLGQHMDVLLPPAGRIFLQTHVWPSLTRDGRVAEIFMQLCASGG